MLQYCQVLQVRDDYARVFALRADGRRLKGVLALSRRLLLQSRLLEGELPEAQSLMREGRSLDCWSGSKMRYSIGEEGK